MLKDIIEKDFYEQLKNGARQILNEDYVRILAHYDGDGTSSAIILTNALKRKNIKFHLGYIKALDGESFRKRIEEDDITTIVVDAGSDQVQYVPEYEKIIVLDHHFFNRTTIKGININARMDKITQTNPSFLSVEQIISEATVHIVSSSL